MRGLARDLLLLSLLGVLVLYVLGLLPNPLQWIGEIIDRLADWIRRGMPLTGPRVGEVAPTDSTPEERENEIVRNRQAAEELCELHGGISTGIFGGIGNPFVNCGDGTGFDLRTRSVIWRPGWLEADPGNNNTYA